MRFAPPGRIRRLAFEVAASLAALTVAADAVAAERGDGQFEIVEATIDDVHGAIRAKEITAVGLVETISRASRPNGTGARARGLLGRVETIRNAGQINALSTLNLRPAARKEWGFDDRKARSMTDSVDDDPAMRDALEIAAALDEHFAETRDLVGPLHGVVIAIKDQYDTFDMRTTSGGDASWANDRPPDDATFVKRLRDAGAIIIAKANMGEYAGGDRSAFGGTFCNPYDTERTPGRSSGGSGSAVAANLAMCAIAEESGPSARNPGKNNNAVALSPTQELVSRDGMIPASFMNDRVGPICRTVEDVARILDVIAGYDPADELTAFSVGRLPPAPYASYTQAPSLAGLRIGVMRERLEQGAVHGRRREHRLVDAVVDLRKAGATVVDPGAAARCSGLRRRYAPPPRIGCSCASSPSCFCRRRRPTADHVATLVELAFDRTFPAPRCAARSAETVGERKYAMNRYSRSAATRTSRASTTCSRSRRSSPTRGPAAASRTSATRSRKPTRTRRSTSARA
jgi:hypothetical protein